MLNFLKIFGSLVMILAHVIVMVVIVFAMYFVFIWPFCG